MRRASAILLAALAAALSAALASAATPRGDARAFTKATLAFDLAHGNAVGREERAGDARRTAGQACLDTLRAAPAEQHPALFTLYFAYLSAGYFSEDEAIFARWVAALKRVRTSDANLRRARGTVGLQLAAARRVYAYGKDFCAPVQRWAEAGWGAEAAPTVVKRLNALRAAERKNGAPTAGISAGARLLRSRGGQGGMLAASVLQEGIDEPDDTVIAGDDPIVQLLDPTRG